MLRITKPSSPGSMSRLCESEFGGATVEQGGTSMRPAAAKPADLASRPVTLATMEQLKGDRAGATPNNDATKGQP
jgi:hypothetical protein